jgi:hypothetical protein
MVLIVLRLASARLASAAPARRELSRDEQRELIIQQGEAFCGRFPDDRVCHPTKE